MSHPLEYMTPAQPLSQASIILGVLSIACVPSAFALPWLADRLHNDLLFEAIWLIPFSGMFMGLSGIACRKSSTATAARAGLFLNSVLLGLFLLARTGFFGWQD